jgi:type IV secretion system protein VirB11
MLLRSNQERCADRVALAAFNRVSDTASLRDKLQSLGTFLADPAVRTICINRPGEVFNRTAQGWTRYEVASLSRRWCEEFLWLLSAQTLRSWCEEIPFLSATLPAGEQVQIVGSSVAGLGTLSITIDKPGRFERDEDACFAEESTIDDEAVEQRMQKLNGEREFWAFYSTAIAARKNIVIADPIGSGNATFTRTFTNFLMPGHERVLSIGMSPEPLLPGHLNRVHVTYSAKDRTLLPALVRACQRMKPDRVLLAHMAPEIAHAYVIGIASRYRGCITTVQARNCNEAFEHMADAIRASETGRAMPRLDVVTLLRGAFDVVIQLGATAGTDETGLNFRRIDDVAYVTG